MPIQHIEFLLGKRDNEGLKLVESIAWSPGASMTSSLVLCLHADRKPQTMSQDERKLSQNEKL